MGFSLSEMSRFTEIMKDRSIWKAILAELIGTMILVFVGCGSCLTWDEQSAPTMVQIALAFGITVATVAQAIGHISGCHINPAVSVGMCIAAKMKPIKTCLYIIFQCIGAVAGAALLKAVTPDHVQGSLGMTVPHESLGMAQAFGIEFFITMVLVLTIFGVCDENRNDIKGSAPLAIGLSITACHLAAVRCRIHTQHYYAPIPIESSMNPARTFGTAVITQIWKEHWLYWMGPCAGGAVAALLYKNAFRAKVVEEDTRNCEYEPCAKGDAKEVEEPV